MKDTSLIHTWVQNSMRKSYDQCGPNNELGVDNSLNVKMIVANQMCPDPSKVFFITFSCACIGVFIYLHSKMISHKDNFTRILTEISSIGLILQNILGFSVLKFWDKGFHTYAILIVIIEISMIIIFVSDNYFYYHRYKSISSAEQSFMVVLTLNLYIWILIIFPWFSSYSIAPFFVDTNTEAYQQVHSNLIILTLVSNTVYNLYFTILFIVAVLKERISNKLKIQNTIRSIIHFVITTSFGVMWLPFFVTPAAMEYIYIEKACNVLSMHFLYNGGLEVSLLDFFFTPAYLDRYVIN